MSNSIVPHNGENVPMTFKFGDDEIRIVKQEGDQPLFVASDLCKALGLNNVAQALSRLDPDEKDYIISNDVTVGTNKLTVVTESGMYSLILRSDKPHAKTFKRWVIHEVLPAIRATGSYVQKVEPAALSPLDVLRQMVETFGLQQQQLTEHNERLTHLEESAGWQADYFTVLGYFRKFNLPAPSMNEAQSIGQRATRLSHEQGRGIGKTSDPRFGSVNSYHVSVLEAIVNKPLLGGGK